MKRRLLNGYGLLTGWFLAVVVGLFLLLLCSCKQTEYVTVEKVTHDTTYITKHERDSVWLHDSTYIHEKGDTVLIEKWHTKYKFKEVHDTTYVSKTDSIPAPYPVIKYKEKELTWWQKTRIYAGNVLLFLLAAAIAWYIGGLIKKFMP